MNQPIEINNEINFGESNNNNEKNYLGKKRNYEKSKDINNKKKIVTINYKDGFKTVVKIIKRKCIEENEIKYNKVIRSAIKISKALSKK